MPYHLLKQADAHAEEKFGIALRVYPITETCEAVLVETAAGHRQEFYHKTSTFHYLVVEGFGSFFLDDDRVDVHAGDRLSIAPYTRIYYKGCMKLVLITTPPWAPEGEVETRASAWE